MTQSRFAPSLSIVLTGSGGAGVMTAGQTLLDAATSCGLYGLMTRSTGPQIRGGEAAALIRLAPQPTQSYPVIALNGQSGTELVLGSTSERKRHPPSAAAPTRIGLRSLWDRGSGGAAGGIAGGDTSSTGPP